MSTPTLPPSSLRPLFNPRAPRVPRGYATYGPPSPYRIDARAPMSAVDQRALDTGTHAAVPFVPRSERNGMQGVLPAKGPGVNSDAVQNLLDRAAGTAVPKNIPASGATLATPNGTASVRFDKAGGGLADGGAGPSAPIMGADGKQVGVGRVDSNGQPFDINEARNNLHAAYPEVFQQGSDANKAFAAYANAHGEQAAHEHAAELMRPFDTAKMSGTASAAQVRSELNAPGSSDDVISKAATDKAVGGMAKAKTDSGPFAVGSAGGRLVSAAKNASSLPNAAGNAVESGARAIGLNDETAKGAGDYVRNAPSKAVDEFTNNPNGPVQTAKAAAGYVGDKLSGAAQTVRNMFVPTAPDFPPAGQPGGRIGGTGGVTTPLPETLPLAPVDATASAPPPDDVPNYADGLLTTAGDKIADFADPDDRAWRAAQPGKLLPNYFTAAGPRSQELMAGAPPRTPYVPAVARGRSTVATADNVPNYASGDIFPQEQQVFPSTQPTGNMKSAVIAERNDLKAAGFDDQANAAGKANANGSWTYDPGQSGAATPQPSAPVAPQPSYGQATQPHKLNAHDFDNQWPDPAGLRGRVAGTPMVMGSAGAGSGMGHPVPNYAGGYSKAGMEDADDINHVGASALPPNADTSMLEDHSQQIGGGSEIESDEERRKRLEGASPLSRKSVPNLASGRMPAYAKGRLFAPAINREKAAIASGVGGAPASAKPVPAVLPGVGPAVLNSSERVMPTPQGPAILNRNQQRKLKPFVPSRN